MKRWSTVQDFIANGKLPGNETVAVFEGFASKGDGGASMWIATGDSGTASQTPAQRGGISFTDTTGAVFAPQLGSVFYYDGTNNWFPSPFGDQGEGLYQFNGAGWNYYEQAGGAVSIATTVGLITNAFNYDVGSALLFSGYSNPGDGGGAQWVKTSDVDTPSQAPSFRGDGTLTDATGSVWKISSGTATFDIQYKIPSQFDSWADAIEKTYNKIFPASGYTIDLLMESGAEITEGVLVKNGDFGHYTLSSEDSVTYLSDGFTGVTAEGTAPDSLIVGDRAVMPTLNCLINADDKCNAGYFCYKRSSGNVNRGCGVTYANGLGLYVAASNCFASGSNFSYANRGNRATSNSLLHAEGANFSYARGISWDADDVFGMDVSRGSYVYIMTQSGNITDCSHSAGRGISARRSWVVAVGALVNDCALDGCRADIGARIIFTSGDATNCGQNGVAALNGGEVIATDSDASNAADVGYFAFSLGRIAGAGTTANNCGSNGYEANNCSTIEAQAGQANDCGSNGVSCANGSNVNFEGGEALRSASRGIFCNAKGEVNAVNATIQNSVDRDVRIQRGSTVALNDATTTNGAGSPDATDCFPASLNSISANGIIYG
jgi:hypothetical protein